jgi:HEAT repeat protein
MSRLRPVLPLVGLSLLISALPVIRGVEAEDPTAADEKLLRENNVKPDGPGLLAFLRERSLSEAERAQMKKLVRQLGHEDFEKREAASRQFVAHGRLSIPYLKAALNDTDPEIARRAQTCLDDIEGGPGPSLPAAVVRCLARKKPDGAVEMLLRYVLFADDETVEDECLAALRTLALKDGKVSDLVLAALQDTEPMRRAAAAYTAASASDKEHRQRAAKLLDDKVVMVRFRTIQGLLAARDPQGVPALIEILGDAPSDYTWRAEDLLIRLAGDKAPTTSYGSEAERKKSHAAWSAWWKENEKKVDVAKIDEAPPFLNLTLVCEMHGNKIWEVDQTGKVRWTMDKLNCPRDAQILPGGRILITEVNDHKVREREIATSKILWEHDIQDPAFVRRLPNGNTFIADHQHCYELTPSGSKVFEYTPTDRGGEVIHSIDRRPNGNVVCMMMGGLLREVNREGKTVREFTAKNNNGGNWCGVQALPGNRYLCVEFNQSEVFEFDAEGKEVWKCKVQGATYAQRLPNGNTMVCCFSGNRVVHVNRDGKVVWETQASSSPWRARVR